MNGNTQITMLTNIPDYYFISGDEIKTCEEFIIKCNNLFENECELIQIRSKGFSILEYEKIIKGIMEKANSHRVTVMLNSDMVIKDNLFGAHGVHLTTKTASSYKRGMYGDSIILSMSCHNMAEIKQAEDIGVSFITLSPVCKTKSHPEAEPIGWEKFANLAKKTNLPVFALGGLHPKNLDIAKQNNAAGIASIRGLWGE